ncbi:MAG: ABC transporter substrate-binding protein, partial [Peptococcaceae bacterium]|nr:ABC transporter substrate-binding protein [Peptococcaceae bacterium]
MEDNREAIYCALDREAICEARGFGVMNPTYQIFPKGFKGYIPELDPDQYSNPYDPLKAKELLSQAGYPDGFRTVMNVPPTIDREFTIAM